MAATRARSSSVGQSAAAGALCVGRARGDRVHADPVRRPLDRERPRHREQPCLGSGGMHRARAARPRVARQDADDRAAVALLDHLPRGGAGAEEAAVEHDRDDGPPAVRREVFRLDDEVAGRVVDERRRPGRSARRRPPTSASTCVRLAHVRRLSRSGAACAFDERDGLLERLRPAAGDDDARRPGARTPAPLRVPFPSRRRSRSRPGPRTCPQRASALSLHDPRVQRRRSRAAARVAG